MFIFVLKTCLLPPLAAANDGTPAHLQVLRCQRQIAERFHRQRVLFAGLASGPRGEHRRLRHGRRFQVGCARAHAHVESAANYKHGVLKLSKNYFFKK